MRPPAHTVGRHGVAHTRKQRAGLARQTLGLGIEGSAADRSLARFKAGNVFSGIKRCFKSILSLKMSNF